MECRSDRSFAVGWASNTENQSIIPVFLASFLLSLRQNEFSLAASTTKATHVGSRHTVATSGNDGRPRHAQGKRRSTEEKGMEESKQKRQIRAS